jgi:hypothetical protein
LDDLVFPAALIAAFVIEIATRSAVSIEPTALAIVSPPIKIPKTTHALDMHSSNDVPSNP